MTFQHHIPVPDRTGFTCAQFLKRGGGGALAESEMKGLHILDDTRIRIHGRIWDLGGEFAAGGTVVESKL